MTDKRKGVISILIGVLLSPAIPIIFMIFNNIEQPIIPENLPANIVAMYRDYAFDSKGSQYEIKYGVVKYSENKIITFVFTDGIDSVDNFWYGENATIEIVTNKASLLIQGTPKYQKREWGDTISGSDAYNKKTDPCFDAKLPKFETEDFYKEIQITARMKVIYPFGTDNRKYIDKEEYLSKIFNIYLISDRDASYLDKKRNWDNNRISVAIFIDIIIGLIVIISILVGIEFVLRKRSSWGKNILT